MSTNAAPDLALLLRASVVAVKDDPREAKARFKETARRNDPNPACPHCGKRHRTLTEDQCLDRAMSERKLQDRVLYRAKKYGWKVAHAGRGAVSEREDGSQVWITPMAEGWPDLSCFKAGHSAIYIELKKELGEVTPEQWEWLELMNQCGARAVVVRPSDLREGRVDAIFRVGSKLEAL